MYRLTRSTCFVATASDHLRGPVQVLRHSGPGAFTVGSGPFSVATGDFNNDGHFDIITANNLADTVSVLLGDGDGHFPRAVTALSVGKFPRSVAVADFNNDANLAPGRRQLGRQRGLVVARRRYGRIPGIDTRERHHRPACPDPPGRHPRRHSRSLDPQPFWRYPLSGRVAWIHVPVRSAHRRQRRSRCSRPHRRANRRGSRHRRRRSRGQYGVHLRLVVGGAFFPGTPAWSRERFRCASPRRTSMATGSTTWW